MHADLDHCRRKDHNRQLLGDADNQPSSGNAAYLIDRAASTTSIVSVAPNPPSAGTAYSVTVSVSGFGTPGGTVTVSDGNGGSCVVTLPAASCNLNSTVAGALTLTANYAGDVNNLPSSGTFAVTVQQAATSTTLSANPDPAIVGMSVQLSISVTQPGAGASRGRHCRSPRRRGADSGRQRRSGERRHGPVHDQLDPIGLRSLCANYLGDAKICRRVVRLDLAVNRVPTTTTLVVTPNNVLRNTNVRLDITVGGGVAPLDGTVSVTSNGLPIAECQNLGLVGGAANCQFRALLEGNFTLVATYSGDADDDSSSGSAGLTVGVVELPVGGPWLVLILGLGLSLVGTRALRRT